MVTVILEALPGVVFSAPIPKGSESAVPYSQMRVGSNDVLRVDRIAVAVDPVEGELPAVTAYRKVLRQVVAATLDTFLEARELVMEKARQQMSL